MKLTYGEIKTLFPNHSLTQADNEIVVGFSRDSRQIKPGEIFVAIKGDKFDGHDYVKEALDRGAAAVLVEHPVDLDHGVISVPDVTVALGQLAWSYRNKFLQPVIAITGSSGKTTTKELLSHVLSSRGPVVATQGNLNNQWGVPFTIFEFNDTAAFFIVEMGMNHPGEVRRLAQITRPNAALITTVGRAHLEGMGSLEGVAKGKGELFESLTSDDVAFVFGDDPFIRAMPTKARRICYGFEKHNEIRAEGVSVQERETCFEICIGSKRFKACIPLVGRHQAQNALAVFAVAQHFGLSEDEILNRLTSFSMQMNRGRKLHWHGATIIDDTYNANPDSVKAMIQSFCAAYPRIHRIAVLGGMRELGPAAAALHFEAGQLCKGCGVDELLVFGEHAGEYLKGFGYSAIEIENHFFASHADLAEALKQRLSQHPDAVVLVKGSRGMIMERVFVALGITFS